MTDQQAQGEEEQGQDALTKSLEAMTEEKRKAEELLERRLSRLEEAAWLSKLT